MSKTKATASAAVDATNDAAPPLNFSFKCLAGLQDCLDEEPRFEQCKLKKSPKSGKYKTKSVRFNNNAISDYECFDAAMEGLLESPNELEWVDLSFNDISTVNQVLLNYPNLKTIYLHGNSIERLNEVDKLAGLANLKAVSLHGNPIENISGYKDYIISTLPQIQKLDFIRITKADRANSHDWNQKFGARFKKKAGRAVKN